MLTGSLLLTGGSGTLGRAIVRRATAEKWDCDITVYSRDPVKQIRMKQEFPNVRFVLGDIRDYDSLYRAAVGHDTILHLAAMKHIPQAEANPVDCIETNVTGSRNVADAAVNAGVKRVLGISTDKVCYPINVYGDTKRLMEAIFQEYNRLGLTSFHLCRYGNVIGSTESVVPVWRAMLEKDGYITATDPDMTRFWMTRDQAVDVVLLALNEEPGTVVIPLAPSLDMRRFAEYTMPEGTEFRYGGLRPGEKRHECLITAEEARSCVGNAKSGYTVLYPGSRMIGEKYSSSLTGYYSNEPLHWLTRDELLEMLA